MAQNVIKNVAIIGATGHLGKHFTEELVKSGKHNITAITRADSKASMPSGVKVAKVDYDDENSLVSALKDQQFLVITLAAMAPQDLHSKIVKAAAKAGVPYVMPNAYGSDIENESLREEDLYGSTALKNCEEIKSLGSNFIALTCGFWYEWSLVLGGLGFGIDIPNKKVTLMDDGKTRINVTTWTQCGRALAGLLSLPESGAHPSVEEWKNKPFYISSFNVSQRDILDSVNRVVGTTDKDWEISTTPSADRYKEGMAELQAGNMMGFAKAMYSRVFYPNGGGDFESSRGLANTSVGLPKETIDEATKRAVDLIESGWSPFG